MTAAGTEMIALDLFHSVNSVLCLGAHPDDVEIGCGGTLQALRLANPYVRIEIILMTGSQERIIEASAAADRLYGASTRLQALGLRDGYLPYDGATAKQALCEAVSDLDPDLVLTHRLDDLHQDHQFVAELTGQLFRDHTILRYEVPKYDGDLARCNSYVSLTEDQVEAKINTILELYESQNGKHWMKADVFKALMRLRGVESRAASGFAEGFDATKLVIR